jgi:hypothetical protein
MHIIKKLNYINRLMKYYKQENTRAMSFHLQHPFGPRNPNVSRSARAAMKRRDDSDSGFVAQRTKLKRILTGNKKARLTATERSQAISDEAAHKAYKSNLRHQEEVVARSAHADWVARGNAASVAAYNAELALTALAAPAVSVAPATLKANGISGPFEDEIAGTHDLAASQRPAAVSFVGHDTVTRISPTPSFGGQVVSH